MEKLGACRAMEHMLDKMFLYSVSYPKHIDISLIMINNPKMYIHRH